MSKTSVWRCADSDATVFDNRTCTGVDLARYNTTATVTSPAMTKWGKTLLIDLIFVCSQYARTHTHVI